MGRREELAHGRREVQVRRLAKRLGLVVRKSRRRVVDALDQGLYRVEDSAGAVLAGDRFELTLDQVEAWLVENGPRRSGTSSGA